MKNYLNLLQHILNNGERRDDRTGVGTISVFGEQIRFNLRDGFPAVTTKKLAWRAVVSELLWFIEGSGDERRLAEILHGTTDAEKTTIWTANADADYWTPKAKFKGDLGRVYGVQWRRWQKYKWSDQSWCHHLTEIDQLENLIEGLKNDPHGRRHILTAWNVAELDQMALPPCHVMSQFYVNKNNELSCQMYQRSQDCFLGASFNYASYALLTHMIAQCCGFGVGELIVATGDTHIYNNHVEQVKEQLTRDPLPLPTLWLNPDITDINEFGMDDIKLLDYQCHPPIKAVMAV